MDKEDILKSWKVEKLNWFLCMLYVLVNMSVVFDVKIVFSQFQLYFEKKGWDVEQNILKRIWRDFFIFSVCENDTK